MVCAVPFSTSVTPTMPAPSVPSMNGAVCEAMALEATRLNAATKLFAVTASPVENL